jgi:hypothetical protein
VPVPRLARSRLRFVMFRLPAAGGHVSRPRRAGYFLLGKLRDMSRNCQHDMSRNYRVGGLTACPVACLCRCRGHPRGRRRRFAALNRGRASARSAGSIGRSCRRDWAAGFRLPGARHGRARRDLRSRCPAAARGCRPRRACRSGGGRRHRSRPGGRRRPPRLRFAAMTSRTPWVSAPGRSGSRRLTAGEVRNSFTLSRRRERTPPPGLRGPRCPPAASASAAGAAGPAGPARQRRY